MSACSRSGSLIRISLGTTALVLGLGWVLGGVGVAGDGFRAVAAEQRPGAPWASNSTNAAAAATATAAATVTRAIVLKLGSRTISLVDNGSVLGTWPVAIGHPASPTPTGRFAVLNMVVNPQYQSTRSGRLNPRVGPDGPLGDRWLGFLQSGKNQFGIHGTPDAWAWAVTSRAAVTNGCVRMLRAHVHQLFDQVEVGTPVVVSR